VSAADISRGSAARSAVRLCHRRRRPRPLSSLAATPPRGEQRSLCDAPQRIPQKLNMSQ